MERKQDLLDFVSGIIPCFIEYLEEIGELKTLKLGVIGLPMSGKTTIFHALTGNDQPGINNSGRYEVRTAVVDVPDERVDRLATLFRPQKTTYAKVTYADITGLEGDSGDKSQREKNGLSGSILNQLSQMEGFIHVVRCFENQNVPHLSGSINPSRDIESLDGEFILNDLISVERRLERLSTESKKGNGRDKALVDREIGLMERFRENLSEGIPLRNLDITADEEKIISGYNFLSQKPALIVLNIEEGQESPDVDYPHQRSAIVPLQGRLEKDLAQLSKDDAQVFMQEFKIEELGLHRVIRKSYDLLEKQSFYTVGEDEVRAWTVRRGAPAMEAAGVIHSDLQKGFIRAEVVNADELITLGGLSGAKARGRLRLEGKEYPVQDGDILHVRFNN